MTKTTDKKKTANPFNGVDIGAFRALVAKHSGQWHLIAADKKGLRACGVTGKPVSRQAFTARVVRHFPDLMRVASDLRDAAGISGPRFEKFDTPAQKLARRLKERARIVEAIEQTGSAITAAAALGISQRTMTRRIKDLKITPRTLSMARRRAETDKPKGATA